MTSIFVYVCFFVGLIYVVKSPFKLFFYLKKNSNKFGGDFFGKRIRNISGTSGTGTGRGDGIDRNNHGSDFNCRGNNNNIDGNCDGIPVIDYDGNNVISSEH